MDCDGYISGADALHGGDGNDIISAGRGNDAIYGEAGNDSIITGLGNDTVYFGRGEGQDAVSFTDSTSGRIDLLQLGIGIATNQVRLVRGGTGNNDLIVQLIGSTDQVTVTGYFAATSNRLTGIKFTDSGTTWNQTQIQTILNAGGTTSAPVQTVLMQEDDFFAWAMDWREQRESSGAVLAQTPHRQSRLVAHDLLQLTQAMAAFGGESDGAVFGQSREEIPHMLFGVSAVRPVGDRVMHQ